MNIFRKIDRHFKFKNPAITVGIFDGVHRGHQALLSTLNEIAMENNGESVMITFDPLPVKFFQPDIGLIELTALERKLELFSEFGIDNVIIIPFNKTFTEMTAEDYIEQLLIEKIGIHSFITGRDHVFGKNRQGNFSLLEKYAKNKSFNLIETDMVRDLDGPINSTRIRAALMLGNKAKARELLGHD